jgi:predicted enzyme related to lactoylglutathione lyase
MGIPARYVHTNLVAQNFRSLAKFYQDLFDCVPVPPEREYRGDSLDAGTGLKGAHLRGVHLRLPGHGEEGPTLEIFNYDTLEPRCSSAVNRPGFGHIAFSVDDVKAARDDVVRAGGRTVGEIVTLQTSTGAKVTWCYTTDPEGNIIELNSWSE